MQTLKYVNLNTVTTPPLQDLRGFKICVHLLVCFQIFDSREG